MVVSAEQGRHPRGVRGAARVLEQQRVKQIGAIRGPLNAELVGETHPDQTRTGVMTGGLALGQVQRVRESWITWVSRISTCERSRGSAIPPDPAVGRRYPAAAWTLDGRHCVTTQRRHAIGVERVGDRLNVIPLARNRLIRALSWGSSRTDRLRPEAYRP